MEHSYCGDIIAQGHGTITFRKITCAIADTYDWEGNGNPDVNPITRLGPGWGRFQWRILRQTAIFPGPAGDIGHWVFLVGTYDGANWNLYRDWNGALAGAQTSPMAESGLNYAQGASGSIGSRSDPNPIFQLLFSPGRFPRRPFSPTALDADTISNLYNAVASPAGHYAGAPGSVPGVFGIVGVILRLGEDGPGTLSYQWLSNNVALSGQTDTNFAIGELDRGLRRCHLLGDGQQSARSSHKFCRAWS